MNRGHERSEQRSQEVNTGHDTSERRVGEKRIVARKVFEKYICLTDIKRRERTL